MTMGFASKDQHPNFAMHGRFTSETVDMFSDEYQQALARKTDPVTSHRAAGKVRVNEKELAVLKALHERGASNWDEITDHTGMRAGSISPRFKPLREKGLIRDTGDKAPGISGSQQIVWEITPEGVAHLEGS